MLKIVGAALICAALTWAGFWFAAQMKRRVRALEDAVCAVELLKSRITLLLTPLDEAVDALAEQNALLKRLADAPEDETLRSTLAKHGLSQPEIGVMEELFAAIPSAGAGAAAHFDAAAERLRIQLELQREAVKQSAALYPKLGLLAGAAVFLMLI